MALLQDLVPFIVGVLIVALGVAASIALHEVGHLVPAKVFGVKVTRFMVGFGRTLWSKQRGETEYGIKLLPFGGYVQMIGMYPPKKPGEAPREASTGFLDSMANDAREFSAETITPGDEKRSFYLLPAWKKIIIMLGGPLMNLVLGVVLYAVLLSGIGVASTTTTVAALNECLKPVTAAEQTCAPGDPTAPGVAAGLAAGDTITAISGKNINTWDELREIIAANPNTPLEITYERAGETRSTVLTPALTERAVYTDAGQPVLDANGDPQLESVGMIGALPETAIQRQPLSAVPRYVGDNVSGVVNVILHLPHRLIDVWNAAFGTEERDPNGPISVVGVGRIAGEIASHDGIEVKSKVSAMVGLLAGLNIALFVFNLIPLLPLDGGHVAGAVYESAKRRLYRLFGKPDPGPIDTAKMVPFTFAMVLVFGAMSLLLIYADLVKPITLQ